MQASTLVVAEHDGGKLKDSSLSAIAAAGGLGESSTIAVLLGGTGPTLQQAASSASKAHPSITKVQRHWIRCSHFRSSDGGNLIYVAKCLELLTRDPQFELQGSREARCLTKPWLHAGSSGRFQKTGAWFGGAMGRGHSNSCSQWQVFTCYHGIDFFRKECFTPSSCPAGCLSCLRRDKHHRWPHFRQVCFTLNADAVMKQQELTVPWV